MGMANTGLVRAEGVRVTTVQSTDLLLLQRVDPTTNQYTPRMIPATAFATNARFGTATLTAGTVTVSNTSVTANTMIILSRKSINGSTAIGTLTLGTITAATSFVINSLQSNATTQTNDVSIVWYILIETA